MPPDAARGAPPQARDPGSNSRKPRTAAPGSERFAPGARPREHPGMTKAVLLACLVAIGTAGPTSSSGAPAGASPILVKAAHLLDGVADRPRDGVAVLVDNGRIVAVAPAGELAAKNPGAR